VDPIQHQSLDTDLWPNSAHWRLPKMSVFEHGLG